MRGSSLVPEYRRMTWWSAS